MSIHPYFSRLKMPAQVAVEVSDDLAGIIVVPCRGSNRLFTFLTQLADTRAVGAQWEVIVVWYTSSWDDELVMQENMSQLFRLERFKRQHPDLQVHGLSLQHLPHNEATALATKVAMDEAAYRLALARQPAAPILLWDADYTIEGDLLTSLSQLPVDEEIWFIHTESDVAHKDRYTRELSHLYWQLGLQQANYPHIFPANHALVACRQQTYVLYDGLAGKDVAELLHLQCTLQMNTASNYLSDVIACGPIINGPALPIAAEDGWLPVDWFKDVALFQEQWEQLPMVDGLSAFNQWLLRLPQAFVAFLTEQRFPVTWLALRQGARSVKALERELYNWWSPERVRQMAATVVPLYYRYQPRTTAISQLLTWMGQPTGDNWELHYQVKRLRQLYQAPATDTKKGKHFAHLPFERY